MTAGELAADDSLLKKLFSGPAAAILLAVLVLGTYAYSASFNYIWDDDTYVTENPYLRSFDGLSRIWVDVGATPQYYPVTFTSFWIEYQLFATTTGPIPTGLNPIVPHTTNILLHLAAVLLLWTILRKLDVPGAWFAAAVFAVHPIHVESVAWVTERKNVLSLAFALLSLWVYLRYAGLIAAPAKPAHKPKEEGDEEDDEGVQMALPDEPWRLYALFLFLFVCGVLAKTTVSVLPGVILVIVWWKRGKLSLSDLKPLLVPIALGLGAGAITSYLEHNPYQIGASGSDWNYGIADRIVLAGQVSWFYVGKLLLPHPFVWGDAKFASLNDVSWTTIHVPAALKALLPWPLMFSYPRWALSAKEPLQWLGTAGVIGVLAALWALRARVGRGAIACVLIYLGCLVPAMGFANVFPMRYSWVADHFAYVASIGLIVMLAAGAAMLVRRLSTGPIVALALGSVVLGLLSAVSIIHSHSMKDSPTLWTSTLARNPQSWMAAGNLGAIRYAQGRVDFERLLDEGKQEEAVAALDRGNRSGIKWLTYATEIKPDAPEMYYQLAVVAEATNELDLAIGCAQRSDEVAVETGKPKSRVRPLLFLARMWMRKGDFSKAEMLLLELQSASLEGKLKRTDRSSFADARLLYVDLLRKRITNPMDPTPQDQQAIAEAMIQLGEVQELLPANQPGAPMRVAMRLAEIGRLDAAAPMVADALSADPNNPDAQYVSALLFMMQNQDNQAGQQLSKLIRQHPGFMPPRTKLAELLVKLNRKDEALQQLDLALEREPRYAPALEMRARLQNAATQPTTAPSTMPTTAPATAPTTAPATP